MMGGGAVVSRRGERKIGESAGGSKEPKGTREEGDGRRLVGWVWARQRWSESGEVVAVWWLWWWPKIEE